MLMLKLVGMEDVSKNIDMVSVVVRDKILKKALKAAGTPIVDSAKAGCPVAEGTLKDSIGMVITSKGAKGNWVRAFIGPRTNIKVPLAIVSRGTQKGLLRVAIPTRYAHLVEFGHNVVVNGQTVGSVAPVAFMRGAWDSHGGETALNIFEMVCSKELDEAIAKLPNSAFIGRAA